MPMELVIAIIGALGAWLLVGGPLYQGALELREQEIDRDAIGALMATVPEEPRMSPWWWLVPPVAYVKLQRRSRRHHAATMQVLGPEHAKSTVTFLNKARGWFIDGAGAFLIAIKETWEVS